MRAERQSQSLSKDKAEVAAKAGQQSSHTSEAATHSSTLIHPILHFQHMIGNQAVQRLLRSGRLQAKLTVSQPGDKNEREADWVAEQVVAPPGDQALHPKCAACAAGIPCSSCEAEDKRRVRRKTDLQSDPAGGWLADDFLRGLGPGQPLDLPTRASMESRFSHDFSAVRVHTGAQAAEAAGLVQARAFTVGRDVVFGAGQYAPGTSGGRRLLAHELTHVVQQGAEINRQAIQPQMVSDAPMTSFDAPMSVPATMGEAEAAPRTFAESLPAGSRISSPAPPESETITFEGIILADDADYVRYQLEELVRERGRGVLGWFPFQFESRLITSVEHERGARIQEIREEIQRERERERGYYSEPGGLPGGVPWNPIQYAEREEEIANIEQRLEEDLRLPRAIAYHLIVQASDINVEIEALFRQFSLRSELITKALLDESKRRVEAERIRYGIERETDSGLWSSYSMEETLSSRGLAGAAQDLAEKKGQLADLVARRQRLVRGVFNRLEGEYYETISDQAEYDRLSTEIEASGREYEIARASAETRYPVLAAFAGESGTRSLSNIAEEPWARAWLVGTIIYDRLKNIQRTREGLERGEIDPWTLPEIVTLTMAETGVRLDTMYERVIRDEVARRSEKGVLDWILAGIALVLGIIAAIPTGGSSLAVAVSAAAALTSAGISGYMLAKHIKEYELESAKAATDFDRARSISQDEPSAFWLALDIVFFVADLGAAAQAFRRLAPLARQALGSSEEALQSLEALRNAADEIDPQLGSRVLHHLARLRGGGEEALEVAGAAGRHEAESLAKAGRELAEEAAETIGTVLTPHARHTVKLTRGGRLVLCTSCRWIRDIYFEVLSEPQNRNLWNRLEDLEDLSARAARTPPGPERTALNRRIHIRTRMLLRDLEAEELGRLGRAADIIEEGPLEGLRIVEADELRLSRAEADLARDLWGMIRQNYAAALGVPPGGQVHHAIEVQALWRYPGVLTEAEINAFVNMRGIPPELAGRLQLHNSAIRLAWNEQYRLLDEAIQARGLVEGTAEFDALVREWLTEARRFIDWRFEAFYTPQTRGLQNLD